MTKRKDFTPEALRFARLAWTKFGETNPTGATNSMGCAFFVGFAVAVGYARLVGIPSATDQEAISAEAVRLAGQEEGEP